MLRLLVFLSMCSAAVSVCYDKENSPNGDPFPESLNGRECPKLGCVDCGSKYCPEEGATESNGNGGTRSSQGCFEFNDLGQILNNRNCVQDSEECVVIDCQASDIACVFGTIGGTNGECTCTCRPDYQGTDCSIPSPTTPSTIAPTPVPPPRVVCIETGNVVSGAEGVFPEVSTIDGRTCPRLGCIDCGSGLPVNGQPPSDLGYCPASEGCTVSTSQGGFVRNPNCVPEASQCGGDTTPSPPTEEYYVLDSGRCANGGYIRDQDECEAAAVALELSDTTLNNGQIKSKSRWPTGCWYNSSKNRLFFNERVTNKAARGNKQLLCYGIPPNTLGV